MSDDPIRVEASTSRGCTLGRLLKIDRAIRAICPRCKLTTGFGVVIVTAPADIEAAQLARIRGIIRNEVGPYSPAADSIAPLTKEAA